MNKTIKLFTSMSLLCALAAPLSLTAGEEAAKEAQGPSLFDRIGGEAVSRQIVADIWHNHNTNPIVKDRFADSDPAYVKKMVYEIFAAATGADVEYTGKDMKTAHHTMNISEMEFNAVVDDVMAALEKNGVAQQEANEVLAILWSVRPDIVNKNITTKVLTQEQASN